VAGFTKRANMAEETLCRSVYHARTDAIVAAEPGQNENLTCALGYNFARGFRPETARAVANFVLSKNQLQ
jgi:hypothetical protein